MKGIVYFTAAVIIAIAASLAGCGTERASMQERAAEILREQVMEDAAWAMQQEPVTVTAFSCDRSAGGIHDFYSEGDYWWQNPEDPDGPYVRRDGQSNPSNFTSHRTAMIRLSRVVGALASAYILTEDEQYAARAMEHCRAWFVTPETMMNPNLQYAQAIKGVTTGRGIGIIDTIQLMEVAQGLLRIEGAASVSSADMEAVRGWFASYLQWLSTSSNGIDERDTKNNHAACWAMQAASFAKLTGDEGMMRFCRERFREILLPGQMAPDGSFPLEIERTKPYGYSLFNLDAMVSICQILSVPQDELWAYVTADGRNIRQAIEFMYPYVDDKSSWPYGEDVMYWDEWPVAHPAFLFGALAYNDSDYFNLWARLPHNIAPGEVERNVPVRNPLIWIEQD